MGRDPPLRFPRRSRSYFNPLSPHGERLGFASSRARTYSFQSTLPAWGETWGSRVTASKACSISIHSPRMGRDKSPCPQGRSGGHFNPLSPQGERPTPPPEAPPPTQFQSTLPAWGETVYGRLEGIQGRFQSTLPHGERHSPARPTWPLSPISIHSPRMGRDAEHRSGRRADQISIHSPRMGRDLIFEKTQKSQEEISIHSPRMGRDTAPVGPRTPVQISIHSPRMGRDRFRQIRRHVDHISIHSPRMGRDAPGALPPPSAPTDFNPLSPHGERPVLVGK